MELFQKRNLEMSRNVVKTLISRGLISDAADALEKIKNAEWLGKHGYGHVAHVLANSIRLEDCEHLFPERQRAARINELQTV